MPVGPYDSHAECVADNQDKNDPDAFCAWLKDRTSSGQVVALQVQRGDIRAGSWVEWTWQDGTAQGQVESVHTEGPVNVPGADVSLDADEDNPTALIESWVEVGDSGTFRPTGTMVGRRFASLRRIDPLPEAESTAAGDAMRMFDVEVGGGALPEGYRPADGDDVPDGRSCENCVFYSTRETREVDGVTEGWCDWWEAHVRPDFYCDAWADEMPKGMPDGDEEESDEDEDGDDTVMAYREPDEDEVMGGHEDERMTSGWRGVLAVEGVPTGDGRLMAEGSLRWKTPLPLRWAREDHGGHDGAVVVGRILSVQRNGKEIYAEGDFDLGSEHGQEARRQVEEGLTVGISVDLDDVDVELRMPADMMDEEPAEDEDADVDAEGRVVVLREADDDVMMVMTDARIRAATMVATPAFLEATIETIDEVPAASGSFSLDASDRTPTAGMADEAQRALDWRADGHAGGEENTVQRARSIAARESLSADTIRRMHAFFSRNARYPSQAGFSPGDDGYPSRARVAWGLWGGNAGRSWSRALVERMDSMSLVAAPSPRPPAEWFANPRLSSATPVTVTEEGRVFGHLAAWGTCHTGFSESCVTPPRSQSDYRYFRTGLVIAADGSEIPVGRLTADTGHAGRRLGAADTSAHYDHTGLAVADVAAGEDEFGIWIAGAVRPGIAREQVDRLRASPLSGDWRSVGGSLELVAALAVNSPGFPIPRALVASGRTHSLQAAGVVSTADHVTAGLSSADLRMLRNVIERERKDAAQRVQKAAASRRRVRVADAARRVRRGV